MCIASFVRDKILRVFTFGSPQVVARSGGTQNAVKGAAKSNNGGCRILEAFGLLSSMVHAYIQPWVSTHGIETS